MLASSLRDLIDLLLPVELEVVATLDRSADDEARPSVGEAATPAPSDVRGTSLSLSLALSVIVLRAQVGTGLGLVQQGL